VSASGKVIQSELFRGIENNTISSQVIIE